MKVAQRKDNGRQRDVEFFVEHFNAVATLVIRDGKHVTELNLSTGQCQLLIEVLSQNVARWRDMTQGKTVSEIISNWEPMAPKWAKEAKEADLEVR